MPVRWDEVRRAMQRRDATALDFEAKAALARLARRGDLFRPVLTRRQRLPDGRKWLVIKTGSAHDAVSPRQDDTSALTGRTMARIAEDKDAQWNSRRAAGA
jgi:hypothetical protein